MSIQTKMKQNRDEMQLKLKRKSKSSSVSPELLEKIWRVMINSFIEFEEKNFDKIHRI